jgi:hypothetical protein
MSTVASFVKCFSYEKALATYPDLNEKVKLFIAISPACKIAGNVFFRLGFKFSTTVH